MHVLQALVFSAVGTASRVLMRVLNDLSVEGAEQLEAALQRPSGQALITVSNHVAAMDDPLLPAALLPARFVLQPDAARWTLCATDRCFVNEWMTSFFRAGKVLSGVLPENNSKKVYPNTPKHSKIYFRDVNPVP